MRLPRSEISLSGTQLPDSRVVLRGCGENSLRGLEVWRRLILGTISEEPVLLISGIEREVAVASFPPSRHPWIALTEVEPTGDVSAEDTLSDATAIGWPVESVWEPFERGLLAAADRT